MTVLEETDDVVNANPRAFNGDMSTAQAGLVCQVPVGRGFS